MTLRRALVAGGGGFIGRHLLRELFLRGWSTTVLVRSRQAAEPVEQFAAGIVVGDLCDPSLSVDDLTPNTVVFNLAAAMTTWPQGVETGRLTTQGLIRIMSQSDCSRLIHVSSTSVHGSAHGDRVVDETLPLGPLPSWNHYAKQKLESEQLVWRAHAGGRVAATVLRPSKVIGAGDPGLVPWATKLIAWPGSTLAGDEACRHPVVVVHDLVRGLADCADTPATAGNAYYLTSRFQITKGALLQMFIRAGVSIPALPRAKSIGLAVGRIGLVALDAPWRALKMDSAGPRAFVVSKLERRAGFPVDHDCVISSDRAARDFGWRGDADIASAVKDAVEWSPSASVAQRPQPVADWTASEPAITRVSPSGLGIGSSE